MSQTTINFVLPTNVDMINFCGVYDSNLRCLERTTEVKITANQDGSLLLRGTAQIVYTTKKIMEQMLKISKGHIPVTHDDIRIIADSMQKDVEFDTIATGIPVFKHKSIKAKTFHQEEYINQILMNDLTFGVGPAGTGKTYLAVALALHELQRGAVKKLIFTRPVVETDESLGFLPGTLEEKLDPYIRPLYDAINDMIPRKEFERLQENNQIELAPLAYMRGRTLSDAFIVLDEAQNTTPNQMKMFLTRLGQNSKMVITGDITQIDLKNGGSGLVEAIARLKKIKGIAVHYFDQTDIVRHGLVKKIIEAYENKA